MRNFTPLFETLLGVRQGWPDVMIALLPGDGVVGQLDYFIGKCFDQDADGRLTTGERQRAQKVEMGLVESLEL